MKKLLLASLLGLGAYSLQAQDASTVTVSTREVVLPGEMIAATASFNAEPADLIVADHTWTISPSDAEGNVIGDPIFSETYPGLPDGTFEFPGSKDFNPHDYRIDIFVQDDKGHLAATGHALSRTSNSNSISGAPSYLVLEPFGNNSQTGHTLNLTSSDWITYTISFVNNSFITSFAVIINGTAWSPNTSIPFVSPSQPLDFSVSIGNAQICSQETVIIKFYSSSGVNLISYAYTVHCMSQAKQTTVRIPSGLYYRGDDKHIHKFSWGNNNWNYTAITPSGGWNGVEVAGWLCGNMASDRLFFAGTDGKIYCLSFNGNNSYLSVILNSNSVRSDLQFRDNSELIFIGNDNKVHAVRYQNNTWNHMVINPINGGYGGQVPVRLAVEDLVEGNIYMHTQNNSIFALWLNGNYQWEFISMPLGTGCNGDMAYDNPGKCLYFKGTDNKIHCESWTQATGWVYDPMTSVNGQVTAYNSLTHLQGTNSITFKGPGDMVYSSTKQSNGTWTTDWLNGSCHNVAGDLLSDWTNVYYVGRNKQISNYWWNGSSWAYGPLNGSAPANGIGCSSQFYRMAQEEEEMTGTDVFSVYPNPANGAFEISFTSTVADVQAELYNLMGEKVDAFTFSGTSYRYSPAAALTPGIYLLRVTEGSSVNMKQIVIQ